MTSRLSVIVYIVVVLFGVASWVDINALWVELPILVQELPEQWTLPSYIVAITQLANLGPILYSLVCSGRVKEKVAIYFVIATCGVTCVCMIFFWKETLFVAGAQRSVPLFIMNFILALADCTSTVIFYPFMATFRPAYMTAYFSGEGVGGLLPGLLGLAQGAGRVICLNATLSNNMAASNLTSFAGPVYEIQATYGENRFSFEIFFVLISAIILISGIAYSLLIFHPVCKREHVVHAKEPERTSSDSGSCVKEDSQDDKCVNDDNSNDDDDEYRVKVTGSEVKVKYDQVKVEADDDNIAKEKEAVQTMTRFQYVLTLFLTGWINCLKNSALLAVQSFSCLPYGTTEYHLAVTLANVANPVACFFDLFYNVTSVPALSVLTVLSSLFGAYIMVAAAMSPTPFLVGTIAGSILIVAVWVVCLFLLTYVRVCLASLFRTEGKKGLLHCGVATQVGSGVGGIVMFVLVNILNLFKSTAPCS